MSASAATAPETLAVDEAARAAAEGALLAYPTETVWGLGADARRDDAVARLRRFKGREAAKPLSVLLPGPEALPALEARVPPFASKLAAAFWPGPLTLVLACTARLAPGVAREDGAVGLRCSPHPVAGALARALLAQGAGPLTATSLNRSGAPPAGTRAEAEAVCAAGPEAPRLVAGPDAGGGAPSTVVDATGPRPVVLREGAIAAADLFRLLGE
ncbi:MAG: L-threonylcarbamoyladenylate synthase, partial [Myxococcota bacterium]|nr:L-threonylcarbamoyladenylate synthase [Myxococcota bacterium]